MIASTLCCSSKCWIDAVNEDHLPVDIAFNLPGMSGTELPSDGTPEHQPFMHLLLSDMAATLAQHAKAVETNTYDAWVSEFEKRSHTVLRAVGELHGMYHLWQVYMFERRYNLLVARAINELGCSADELELLCTGFEFAAWTKDSVEDVWQDARPSLVDQFAKLFGS
ncbi:hypothetical protein SeLEV6574_g08310 [Synchytrium endobioticum]|uniref:Uncharacterized protein n=1 Tax=Synchytrium endobioticum TaxID=286115 RepID=A0A507C813_9FUNG|nr:hypothetical protein SeLEV6574_g08310 [Synchytrium endobioticum]